MSCEDIGLVCKLLLQAVTALLLLYDIDVYHNPTTKVMCRKRHAPLNNHIMLDL